MFISLLTDNVLWLQACGFSVCLPSIVPWAHGKAWHKVSCEPSLCNREVPTDPPHIQAGLELCIWLHVLSKYWDGTEVRGRGGNPSKRTRSSLITAGRGVIFSLCLSGNDRGRAMGVDWVMLAGIRRHEGLCNHLLRGYIYRELQEIVPVSAGETTSMEQPSSALSVNPFSWFIWYLAWKVT